MRYNTGFAVHSEEAMRSRGPLSIVVLAVLVLVAAPSAATAGWRAGGVPITLAAGDQTAFAIVADGSGGAVVAWQDDRGAGNRIYAQRLDAGGNALWTADGVALTTSVNEQGSPVIVSDLAGGAIVAWVELNSSALDVHAQRVDVAGAVQWGASAVALTDSGGVSPAIVSDGGGGAIVAWEDHRHGSPDIYAQRINPAGIVQWVSHGVALSNQPLFDDQAPVIASDGAGGAIVAWQSYRGLFSDIVARAVSVGGAVQWAADGVVLCAAAGSQLAPAIAPDNTGGAVVAWIDSRGGKNDDIYAQRVTGAGSPLWTVDGVVVCDAGDNQDDPVIAATGSGSVVVSWIDRRNGTDNDIYAQRLDTNGAESWAPNGIPVSASTGNQFHPAIAGFAGGAIVAWHDRRSSNDYDVYAQRVDAAGNVAWTAGGALVSGVAADQLEPVPVIDGSGGAIVAWIDQRNAGPDVFVGRIGNDGVVATLIALASADADPSRVRLVWHSDGVPSAIVYRRVANGAWGRVGAGAILARREGFEFEDREIVPGETYGYRLGYEGPTGEEFTDEVRVTVPRGSLTLAGLSPNPATRDLIVAFSLPAAGPVTLDLIDLTGRRVMSRSVGDLGIGPHRLQLGDARALAPGVYVVRLTSAARSITVKAAVVR
jgi:hypothetical protein